MEFLIDWARVGEIPQDGLSNPLLKFALRLLGKRLAHSISVWTQSFQVRQEASFHWLGHVSHFGTTEIVTSDRLSNTSEAEGAGIAAWPLQDD